MRCFRLLSHWRCASHKSVTADLIRVRDFAQFRFAVFSGVLCVLLAEGVVTHICLYTFLCPVRGLQRRGEVSKLIVRWVCLEGNHHTH